MAERNKRIFVSDAHISHIPKLEPDKHDYRWLQQEDAQAITNFLKYLNGRTDVEEVVFIGDLFDNWVFPVDVEPPSIDEIIGLRKLENDPLIQALDDLGKNSNIRVVCLPGNHDMELTEEVVGRHFKKDSIDGLPGMIFGGGRGLNSRNGVYRSSRLLAEHGSAHAMFNAPDPINDPSSRLPLGYFITRVRASKAYNSGHRDYHWWTYADDMLEMTGPEKFASCVFEAVLEEAHLNLDTPIIMPKSNINPEPIDARDISRRYQNLYSQWKQRAGEGMAFKSILADIGYLDDAADRLCKKNDTNIVIFGHCHDCELDKDSWFVHDRIYANCGSWCESPQKPWTFAEVETLRDKKERWVRIWEWKGEELGRIIKEDNVNF